jgi:hypothetical protein
MENKEPTTGLIVNENSEILEISEFFAIFRNCFEFLFSENKPADQQDEWQGNQETLEPPSELLTFPALVFADGVFVVLHFRKMIPMHNNIKATIY